MAGIAAGCVLVQYVNVLYAALDGSNLGVDHLFIGTELKFDDNCRVDLVPVMKGMVGG